VKAFQVMKWPSTCAVPPNWHAHEAHSAHAVDRSHLRSAVRLDRDPGRRPLLGHPRNLQAHLGANRIRLPGPALDWGVHLSGDRVPGESARRHQEGGVSRAYAASDADADAEAKVIEHIKDIFWLMVIIYIMAWASTH